MTDPRIDTNEIRRTTMTNRRRVAQLCDEIDRLRAADSAAGVVRVDLNDDDLLEKFARAINTPQEYAPDYRNGETFGQWRQRAIRAALQQPEVTA